MSPLVAWQALTAQPLRFVDRQSLCDCFDQVLSERAIGEMIESARFSERLLELLMAHFQLMPLASLAPASDDDLPVMLLPPATFDRLSRLCGAVWHAQALSREVRGAVVSEWRERLSPEVFNLALQHRDWGGAANLLRSPAELLTAVERDGQSCVADWIAAQPTPLQKWLRLRLAARPAADPVGAGSARQEAASPEALVLQRINLVRRLAAVLQASLDQPTAEPADVPA